MEFEWGEEGTLLYHVSTLAWGTVDKINFIFVHNQAQKVVNPKDDIPPVQFHNKIVEKIMQESFRFLNNDHKLKYHFTTDMNQIEKIYNNTVSKSNWLGTAALVHDPPPKPDGDFDIMYMLQENMKSGKVTVSMLFQKHMAVDFIH